MWERKSGREAWYLNSKSCHLDTERNPDPSGQRLCSKPSLLVAYAAALGQRWSPRNKLQKGPGPCGSPMGSTLPPQSILLPTSVRPLAGHRVTRDSRGVSPSGKWPRIAVGNVCTQTHGPILPSGSSKRNGWEGEKSEEGPGRREERLALGLPSHRLSLRLFLRWGLDWALCGEETSFFRSFVGEGGPVPLPIWMGRKKQEYVLGCPMGHSALPGAAVPGSQAPCAPSLRWPLPCLWVIPGPYTIRAADPW